MLKEFKDFLLKRNVMDLAVGVIIGGALTTIVKAFVSDFLNPLIGLFGSRDSLTKLAFTVDKATFYYGSFINDLISFLITAFLVFLLLRWMNKLFDLEQKKPNEELETLKEIRDLLKDTNK